MADDLLSRRRRVEPSGHLMGHRPELSEPFEPLFGPFLRARRIMSDHQAIAGEFDLRRPGMSTKHVGDFPRE